MTPILRRSPAQERSRERLERILAVASEAIARDGSDGVRMSAIAERAGISIGSLYQYFPDKGAIVRTLAERYNAIGRDCIAAELAAVRTPAELIAAFARLLDAYYTMVRAEPVMRELWSGLQSARELRDVDLEDSRLNGAVLARAMARVRPRAKPRRFETTAFAIMQLGTAAVRAALDVPEAAGDALLATYKRMALGELERALASRNPIR